MVEVQVRSERMDVAEKGYAAHYKYKNGATEESGLDVVELKKPLKILSPVQ
jgi:GTP pyrophosphokinase